MDILTVSLEVLVGVVMLGTAIATFLRPALAMLTPTPEALPGRLLVAILTALPGAAMLAATMVPFFAFFAAALAVFAIAVLWIASRLRGGRPAQARAALLTLAAIGVAILQPLGLKVISLPKADQLPFAPIPAKVVKTYGEGVAFEGVRAGPDGTLYLAANLGLDFTSTEYYRHAQGKIIVRSPHGTERVVFSTPIGSTAGTMAIAPDGTIYMSSNGERPGIWRIGPDGAAQKIATLPTGAWPNGLDFGPDGMLYAADSSLARIWRIDPATGRFAVAIQDHRLAARRFVALAPGANGLRFSGRSMFVTVSDATLVLKYALGEDGRFGTPALVARGIPGDDFAVGKDGSLFVTTHPYNTLVRIAPDGRRTIVAKAGQHIIGATDASFGRGPADRDTLYVVTDGGAFTAGPKARGELIALLPYQRGAYAVTMP